VTSKNEYANSTKKAAFLNIDCEGHVPGYTHISNKNCKRSGVESVTPNRIVGSREECRIEGIGTES
jgi:hypothetical protein